MWQIPPDRYAVELIVAGILGALVKSRATKVGVLEDHVLVPLLTHVQLHDRQAQKATTENEKERHQSVSFECMTWHTFLETVLNGLK
jgi:hypothetical protein